MSMGVGDCEGEYKHFRKTETGRAGTPAHFAWQETHAGTGELKPVMWQLV
jgi:hypothetical protein